MPRVLNKYRDKDAINGSCVWIMRPSKWGNPFVVGVDGGRGVCVDLHEQWLAAQPALLADLHELAGRDLVCCCAPKRCHGDTLLYRANTTPIQRLMRAAALEGFCG